MGCSSSLPSVVIPDPGPTEQCVFTVKSAGMFKGDDCFAYKGDSTDKDSKWMILDKSKPTGDPRVNVAAGQRLLELENFNRAEGSKKGEILLSAVFDSKPAFTVMSKSEFSQTQLRPAWAMQFSKAVPVQIPQCAGFFDVTMPSGVMVRAVPPPGSQPGQVMQICDPGAKTPDSVYIDKAYKMMQQGSFRYAKLKKFSSKTGCSIMPGTRCQQFPAGFHLNVFIEGTTVARYCWVEGHRDDDGHWHEGHYTKSEKAFIDQTCFQLLQKPNEGGGEPTEIASWSCPGELEGGDITTENALFSTMLKGGWASKKLTVSTKEFWDPCLALVISYLTSKEYSPKELKGDFSKTFTWPSGPKGHREHRRRHNRRGNHWDDYDDYDSDREGHSPAGVRVGFSWGG